MDKNSSNNDKKNLKKETLLNFHTSNTHTETYSINLELKESWVVQKTED